MRRKVQHPEVYEISALAPTSTYFPPCLTQIEDARGADRKPESDRAAYGLKALYDCGTAELEYATT